jgi:thiamine biosynthesis lipoprotein
MSTTRQIEGVWAAIAGVALAAAAACAPSPSSRAVAELGGPTMGTTWSVKVVEPAAGRIDEAERAGLQRTAQATLTQIERLMSTWDATSELSRFNASTSLEPFPVAPETFDVFRWSATLYAETGGAMDPTVAPLVDAWGFGVDRTVPPPDEATVERLRADVGMPLVELDPAGAWVRKRRPGVRCSFSALAPGYAADRIASWLLARGYSDFLIDVGGELMARGRNAEGRTWQVAIERPQVEGRSIERVVSLDDRAISTSGDYRNFREVGGTRLPHILDPRTGRPVRHALSSVSVIAREAVRADALSTALMVMGPDEAMAFAEARGLAVLLVVRTADGGLEERTSPAFPVSTPQTVGQ